MLYFTNEDIQRRNANNEVKEEITKRCLIKADAVLSY